MNWRGGYTEPGRHQAKKEPMNAGAQRQKSTSLEGGDTQDDIQTLVDLGAGTGDCNREMFLRVEEKRETRETRETRESLDEEPALHPAEGTPPGPATQNNASGNTQACKPEGIRQGGSRIRDDREPPEDGDIRRTRPRTVETGRTAFYRLEGPKPRSRRQVKAQSHRCLETSSGLDQQQDYDERKARDPKPGGPA